MTWMFLWCFTDTKTSEREYGSLLVCVLNLLPVALCEGNTTEQFSIQHGAPVGIKLLSFPTELHRKVLVTLLLFFYCHCSTVNPSGEVLTRICIWMKLWTNILSSTDPRTPSWNQTDLNTVLWRAATRNCNYCWLICHSLDSLIRFWVCKIPENAHNQLSESNCWQLIVIRCSSDDFPAKMMDLLSIFRYYLLYWAEVKYCLITEFNAAANRQILFETRTFHSRMFSVMGDFSLYVFGYNISQNFVSWSITVATNCLKPS